MAIMIEEEEGRLEVVWLGAAKDQWGHEGLLKEYAYTDGRPDDPHGVGVS
jgi:hypothetical protein